MPVNKYHIEHKTNSKKNPITVAVPTKPSINLNIIARVNVTVLAIALQAAIAFLPVLLSKFILP